MRATFGFAGAMALAVVSVVGLAGLAGAATGDGSGDGSGRPGRPALTDEQKACLESHGVTAPSRPADGSAPTPPTDEQRAAFKAAAEACGLPAMGPGRPGGGRPQLTDEQKACLESNGVTPPSRSGSSGARPAPPTDEQRAAFKAAAEACGLPTPPARGDGAGAQTTALRVSV